jgi:RNA polymerase primary sigma factor
MQTSQSLTSYLDAIGSHELLGAEEEMELCRQAQRGDLAARNRLVSAHLRFVVRVAKRYQHQGLPLQDLVQEGNLGLIRAIDRFDPERGFRFLSYASWWIRQAIVQALMDTGRTVRLPAYKIKRIRKIKKVEAKLTSELGRSPQAEEIAAAAGFPVAAVRADKNHSRAPLHLDAEIFSGEDASFADLLADSAERRPDSLFGARHRVERLMRALQVLPERHRRILELHFGLHGEAPRTLESIGRLYGFSRENARQLKGRALKRLAREVGDLAGGRTPGWESLPGLASGGLAVVEVA